MSLYDSQYKASTASAVHLHTALWASSAKLWHHLLMRMQVVWGELGDSPLESLSVLSSEVAVPLLRSQIRHGRMPDMAALELTDSLQAFVSSGTLLSASIECPGMLCMVHTPASLAKF